MKLIPILISFVIVFLSGLVLSSHDSIGFINDKIYFKMSESKLEKILGESKSQDGTEADHLIKTYDTFCYGVKGKADFIFYNNKLVSVSFISNHKSCDLQKAIDIIEKIKSKYKGDKYYEQEESINKNSYFILFGQTNGATGKDIIAEYEDGILSICAELME